MILSKLYVVNFSFSNSTYSLLHQLHRRSFKYMKLKKMMQNFSLKVKHISVS